MSEPPRQTVPITIAARDEQATLPGCLASLLAAIDQAERSLPLTFDVLVVCDRCSDRTADVARSFPRVRVAQSAPPHGKVEALRAGIRPGPLQICLDADVLVPPSLLVALCNAMHDPSVSAAFPPFAPLPPSRATPLAWALHVYNLRRGFSSGRRWLSGRCFAVRRLDFPTPAEMRARGARLPPDPFLDLCGPMHVEDVWLSRRLVHDHGPSSLVEVSCPPVLFRPPETLLGMYRFYRRLRRELSRVDLLFPELSTPIPPRTPDLRAAAPAEERLAASLFDAALALCKLALAAEASLCRLTDRRPDPWGTVTEAKRPLTAP